MKVVALALVVITVMERLISIAIMWIEKNRLIMIIMVQMKILNCFMAGKKWYRFNIAR